jgi:hypothetical protein
MIRPMTETTEAPAAGRPILITIVCIWILIGIVLMIAGLVVPVSRNAIAREYGTSSLAVAGVSIVLNIIGLAGYWQMRTYGVYAFAGMVAVNSGWCFALGISGLLNLIGPVAVMAVGIYYWDLLDRGEG